MRLLSKVMGIVGIAALVLCVGCGNLSFTEQDDGRTVNLPVDDPFRVVLKGNPTTGYQWMLAPIESDAVTLIGEPAYKPASDRVGGGGAYTFRFQTKGDGEAVLRFVYRRPFESNTPPVQTFSLNVLVGTMGRIEGR